jgi:hypothetical protein
MTDSANLFDALLLHVLERDLDSLQNNLDDLRFR